MLSVFWTCIFDHASDGMNLVFLTTPNFTGSRSMPRFAALVGEGMRERGHSVEYRTAECKVSRFFPPSPAPLLKWARYVDQYLLFPSALRRSIQSDSDKTLYIVTDQGLGMWIPEIVTRPHVLHCHDMLAIRSSLGDFPENRLSLTGRLYQSRIRSGLSRANNFISVSEATRNSLHMIRGIPAGISEVIHNAQNRPIQRMSLEEASNCLQISVPLPEQRPIIHVGGNQWYKNREGVLQIYTAYAATSSDPAPLWMIGGEPTPAMRLLERMVPSQGRVHFMTDVTDCKLSAIYSLAAALLFPSLEEGFGWPVAEAMAFGCPVITTGIAPMTEVGGESVVYVPRAGLSHQRQEWAASCARILNKTLSLSDDQKTMMIKRGIDRATRFNRDDFLDRCEFIYSSILANNS